MIATSNNTIAKIAAVLAGLGLVASSFAAFAPAARAAEADDLQAQINALLAQIAALQGNTGTTAAVTFSQDLTLGSSGAQVTALQNWLISKGYAIAAGATGYFGAQTQAALAKYQAAEGISPASGYFGPITRAKVNAGAGTGTGTGTGSGTGSTGGLSGGEADLSKYDIRSGDGDGSEGQEEVELAVVKFDVEGGDISLQRVELTASTTDLSAADARPWKYFDTIYVYSNGDEIGEVDASDKDEWDEESTDDVYTITISGLDLVVDEDDTAELTFVADISDSIDDADQDQEFDLAVLRDGIRAVDAEGIQQYIGDDSDTVRFGFSAEDNGDLSFRSSSDNPDSSIMKVDEDDNSDEYDVFAFEVRNTGDADAIITNLKIKADNEGSTSTRDIIRRATLEVDGDEFDGDIGTGSDADIDFDDIDVTIDADDTVTFLLKVEFNSQGNHYNSGDQISFSVAAADADAEGADSGDDLTGSDLSGTVSSKTHTLSIAAAEFSDFAWSVPAAGNLIDFTFTVDADDEDFAVLQSSIASSTSGTATTSAGVLTAVGDTSDVTGSNGSYTVQAGGTGQFRIRYTITGTNGTYADVTITRVAGQEVPSAKQQSPTATRNVQS